MEWARTNQHRGFICSWPQLGGPGGLLLANLAVLFFSWLSGDQFLVFGPFAVMESSEASLACLWQR